MLKLKFYILTATIVVAVSILALILSIINNNLGAVLVSMIVLMANSAILVSLIADYKKEIHEIQD